MSDAPYVATILALFRRAQADDTTAIRQVGNAVDALRMMGWKHGDIGRAVQDYMPDVTGADFDAVMYKCDEQDTKRGTR